MLPNSCEGGSAWGSSKEPIADRLSREIDMKFNVTANCPPPTSLSDCSPLEGALATGEGEDAVPPYCDTIGRYQQQPSP